MRRLRQELERLDIRTVALADAAVGCDAAVGWSGGLERRIPLRWRSRRRCSQLRSQLSVTRHRLGKGVQLVLVCVPLQKLLCHHVFTFACVPYKCR